jgi:hypothetical protein
LSIESKLSSKFVPIQNKLEKKTFGVEARWLEAVAEDVGSVAASAPVR